MSGIKIDLHDSVLDHIQADVVRLRPDQTVADALDALRDRGADHDIVYIYVVDDGGRLTGVVPTRALLASRPERPLRDIMQGDGVAIPDAHRKSREAGQAKMLECREP